MGLVREILEKRYAAEKRNERPAVVFIGVDRASEINIPVSDRLFGLRIEYRAGSEVAVW